MILLAVDESPGSEDGVFEIADRIWPGTYWALMAMARARTITLR